MLSSPYVNLPNYKKDSNKKIISQVLETEKENLCTKAHTTRKQSFYISSFTHSTTIMMRHHSKRC